jgi:DNA-binding transcriptional LysR family regulator
VDKRVVNRKVEYLLALTKEGHFARAAAACHVSQPALSAGIQQLELELGVPIVKRGQRFHGLTEQGEIVLAWAQRMVAESQRLHEDLRRSTGSFPGTRRVGVVNFATPLITILALPFERQWPQVALRIIHLNAFELQQTIEDLAVDVAVTYLDNRQRLYSHTHSLYAEEYALLIRRDHPIAARTSVSWEEVRQLPLCLLSPEMRVLGPEENEVLAEPQGNSPQIIMNSVLAVMDHVRTGHWASVLPGPVHAMVSGDPQLVAIPLPHFGEPAHIGIVIPHREPPSRLAEAFFELATTADVLHQIQKAVHPKGTVTALDRPLDFTFTQQHRIGV